MGFEDTFVWGEIAIELGKESAFAKFWKDGPKAPSEKDWISPLIGDEPTLILLMSFRRILTMPLPAPWAPAHWLR